MLQQKELLATNFRFINSIPCADMPLDCDVVGVAVDQTTSFLLLFLHELSHGQLRACEVQPMDSLLIHQQANDLVQNFGTRNIKKIALNVGIEISETDCFHDLLGLFAFQWHDHMIFINQRLDKYTKQMVCGYALGHYLEHPDLNTMKKFIASKNKHITLHEQNAFTSHLMLDSNEIYKLTKQGLDAAQIAALKRIHPNLVLVKLLELYRMGYDLRHYYG